MHLLFLLYLMDFISVHLGAPLPGKKHLIALIGLHINQINPKPLSAGLGTVKLIEGTGSLKEERGELSKKPDCSQVHYLGTNGGGKHQ